MSDLDLQDYASFVQDKQTELGWGKAIVETLVRDLQAKFPGRNGFSAQNLWLMRQFYSEYADRSRMSDRFFLRWVVPMHLLIINIDWKWVCRNILLIYDCSIGDCGVWSRSN
jgi:DUF1016 N-terminal domain